MFALRLTHRALEGLEAIADFIRQSSGSRTVARRFVGRLLQRCVRLSEAPFKLGRSCEELGVGLRCLPEGNYLILFTYSDGALDIMRIVEGHRSLAHLFQSDGDP